MHPIKNKLWDIDPGYLRLKQAFKTVLAIAIAIALCSFSTPEAKLLAGIAAGLSIQGIQASNFKAKIYTLITFDITYSISFFLGLLSRPYPHFVAIGFTLLAFISFYIRRFGSQFNFSGLMLWMFFFMANILPFKTPQAAINNFHGFFIGLFTAALIYLFIYPSKQRRLFVKNYNAFISRLKEGVYLAKKNIHHPVSLKTYTYSFIQHKDQLFKMTAFNKAIVESKTFIDKDGEAQKLTLIQFSLAKDLTIIYEAYQNILFKNTKLPKKVKRDIIRELNKIIRILSKLKINRGIPFTLIIQNKLKAIEWLNRSYINPLVLKDDKEASLVALLNMALGLRLFKENIVRLLDKCQ